MYIVYSSPFETKIANCMEVMNEIFILLSGYMLLFFTDIIPDVDLTYNFGWVMIALILLNLAINTLIIIVMTFFDLKRGLNKIVRHFCPKLLIRLKSYKRTKYEIGKQTVINLCKLED
jgi:hypothetical protein